MKIRRVCAVCADGVEFAPAPNFHSVLHFIQEISVRTAVLGICVWVSMLIAPASLLAATGDIVLYASDATNLHGDWSMAGDATTAGGQLLGSPDVGWSNTDAPLASPSKY